MKLILINGPTGIGKSTISKKIHKEHPMSFLLDIDAQRRYISGYRENRKESLRLVLAVSVAIADEHLASGHDVIIDRVFVDSEVTDRFVKLGEKRNADFLEFILNTDKETLMKRAQERGFNDGSMLTIEKVGKFWEQTQLYIENRPKAVVVETGKKSIDEVYDLIRNKSNLLK